MLETLQEPIRWLLKVPPQPDPPLGAPRSVRVFRAAPGFYRYRLMLWGWKQVGALAGLVFGLVLLSAGSDLLPESLPEAPWAILGKLWWIRIIEYLAIAGFLLQLPLTLLLISLDYAYRWYVTTDRSLRIREGLWKVQERTMTFSNVQNVSIRQGPIQRLFGIADLQVQTAGGGGAKSSGDEDLARGDNLHLGYFRGVDNAEEIRDAILDHLRRARAGGLGDPDDPSPGAPVDEPVSRPSETAATWAPLDAARQVLRETRALADVLARSRES